MDEATLAEGDNTDEIIGAIRRIMSADEEILTGEPGTGTFSKQARERIFAALDRLTGGEEKPPGGLDIGKARPAIAGLAGSQFTAIGRTADARRNTRAGANGGCAQ